MAQKVDSDDFSENCQIWLCEKGIHPPSDIFCDCVQEDDDGTVFLYHKESNCRRKEMGQGHFDFKGDCYFKSARPAWKENCNNIEETNVVDKFYAMFKLKCTCTTKKMCTFCSCMLGSECTDPIFSINDESYLELWILDKMHTHLIR